MCKDNLDFDEEDSLKVFLTAFIERDKKKQLADKVRWLLEILSASQDYA